MPKEDVRVEYMDPMILKPHPVNEEVYRDAMPDQEFLDTVAEMGVVTPLVCLPNNVVLSGHRRMIAARMTGQATVPLVRADITDPDEQARFLVMMNRQRDKTNEQKCREYSILKPIEMEAAKLRRNEDGGGDGRKSRDIAAQAVGMDYRTAEKGIVVLEEIDLAESDEDHERADVLRLQLNKSISKAFKRIRREKDTLMDSVESVVPDRLRPVFELAREIKGIVNAIGKCRVRLEEMFEEDGGEHLPVTEILSDANNWSSALVSGRPFAVCPICKGSGCDQCEDLGWMHQAQWGSLPEAIRKPAIELEVAE